MAKPTAKPTSHGRGGESSDEEEDNSAETIAEVNRIMGRDKPVKQTSAPGMSLAERAQQRMKAAQKSHKPTTSTSSVSSLTTHVTHNPHSDSHHPHAHSHHHTPSSTSHHPQHHTTPSGTVSPKSGGGGVEVHHPGLPQVVITKQEYEPQFSSPMMRNLQQKDPHPPSSSGSSGSSSSHHSTKSHGGQGDPSKLTHSKTVSKIPTDNSKSTNNSSPSLAEHYRTLSVGPPPTAPSKPVDDDPELDAPDDDDEEEEKSKKKKKKKGFFGKIKKAVSKKKDKDKGGDSDSESGEEDEKEAKEMQADIDRIMRGKVEKPGTTAPTPAATGGKKPLSLQERAALAQKRAAGK